MIDFLCTARTREDMELLAQAQGFMDEEGNPALGWTLIRRQARRLMRRGSPSSRRRTGRMKWLPEWHFNLRVSGELEQEQIEGIPQYDPKDGSAAAAGTHQIWDRNDGRRHTLDGAERRHYRRCQFGVTFDPESIRASSVVGSSSPSGAAIVCLFLPGCPAAIIWRIPCFIIDAVECQAGGFFSHVRKEVGKVVPSLKDLDATLAVPFVMVIVWITVTR